MKRNDTSKLARVTKAVRPGLALMLMGLGGFMTACGDGKPKPAHLDIAEDAPSPEQEAWLSQQRLMRVKKIINATGVTTTEEYSISSAVSMLYGVCNGLNLTTSTCIGNFNHEIAWSLCMGRTALEIATVQAEPLQLVNSTNSITYVVDNVTDANASGMAAVASEYARYATGMATQWLLTPPTGSNGCKSAAGATGVWQTHPTTGRPMPLELAAAATEGYYLARAAMDRAIQATVSISDDARSSTVSAQVARERSVLGEEFSRVSAAHMLVGGMDGLLGSTTQGYCLAQDFTPQVRTALGLLRESQLPPNLLLGTADTATMLNTAYTDPMFPACTTCGGSVRQRIGAFNSIEPLKGGQTVQSFYDLSTADFTKARDYLRQEYAVFGRSRFARGAPFPATNGFNRYSGTGRLQTLPPGAWAAMARYVTAATPWYSQSISEIKLMPRGWDPGYYAAPGLDWAPLETLIAGAQAQARNILKSTDHYGTVANAPHPTAQNNEVLGTLASILTNNEYQGVIEMNGSSTMIRGYAHGYKAADKIRVMVGEEGLRCAVDKTIEGASCDDPTTLTAGAQYNCPTWYPGCAAAPAMPADCLANPSTFSCLTALLVTADTNTSHYGMDYYTGTSTGRTGVWTNQITGDKVRLYWVKLKDPTLAEKPGNYELLGGAPLLTSVWSFISVIPSLNQRVADLLAPNKKNCAIPTVNCMGKDYDARLPLEDELTDDGDNVENSWKHYLALAKQAASESDALGRDFKDAKVAKVTVEAQAEARKEEQLQAAEAALEEVQATCGTAIDNRKLLEYFSGTDSSPTNLDQVVLPATTCNSTTPCPNSGWCMAGKCVKNPAGLAVLPSPLASDPDAQRLADCLSPAVEKFVTLGSDPVCIYTANGRPTDICPTSLPMGTACPAPVNLGGACTVIAGHTATIAKQLSYFTNPKPLTPNFNACVALRKARKNRTAALYESDGVTKTPLGQLTDAGLSNGVFLVGRLSDKVGKPGFVSKYGTYFDITEDGTTRWTSGSILKGRVTTTWPHASSPDCDATQDGLFCTVFAAPVSPPWTAYSDMHARVFQAVAAAAAIRGAMDPTKKSMDVTFPSAGTWPVGGNTLTTIYAAGTPLIPVQESKRSINPNTRGTRTCYKWIQPSGDISPWVGPNGITYPNSQSLCFFGPFDPNTDFTGHVTPVMNPWNISWGRPDGFDRVLYTLEGKMLETETAAAVGLSSRHAQVAAEILPATAPNYSAKALIDGYELLCELERLHSGANVKLTGAPANTSDSEQMAAYLQQLADQISSQSALMSFPDIPAIAVGALDVNGSSSALNGVNGDMREAIEDLRAAFLGMQRAIPILSSQVRLMGTANETLKAQLDLADANNDLVALEIETQMREGLLNCALAGVTAIVTLGAGAGGAASACGSLAIHAAANNKKQAISDRIEEDNGKIARAEFAEKIIQSALTLQNAALDLEANSDMAHASIARIDSLRKRAALALAKAVYLASYQGQQQALLDKTVGSLTDVAQTRYVNALKNAKLMSFFARRAIEQRLGVSLVDMKDDLPLVDAPSKWEGEACTMGGIDGLVANETTTPSTDWVAIYGKGFIGEYVNKLERLMESYRLEHNFHEGNDVAVVSLRDDVFDVRTRCEKPSKNLLKYAGELDNAEAWGPRSCNAVTIGGVSEPTANCVQAVRCDTACEWHLATPGTPSKLADVAVKGLRGTQDSAPGFVLRFGDGKACTGANGNPCGWKAATVAGAWPSAASALTQIVTLNPGKYRFSWYTKDPVAQTVSGAKVDIITLRSAMDASGYTPPPPLAPTNFVAPVVDLGAGTNWKRASATFSIANRGDYEIGFGANVIAANRPTDAYNVTIGAPMLEVINPSPTGTTAVRSFQATDGAGMTRFNDCEDTGGINFRRENWRRQCVRLCSEGFTGNCTTGPEYCYQEFTFGIAQPWVASGKLFKYSGFARGNFNYRVDTLGLNFVGSQTRDCTDSNLPSTCYNAGFIPYSIEHTGPFFTRNHEGDDIESMLFDGKIEHARGLALERYVTNPISTTDRELMTDYMRKEFAGRPLDGTFTVRLWEEPGVNLEAVEDIQLVLNYRYWTAFD